MATIGSLVFEMSANVARLQEDMSKARHTVEGTMDGIKNAVETAKHALEALGLAWATEKAIEFVHGAIEAENALYELSIKSGLAVETLSALRTVAAQSGTPLEQVATMTAKLEKNLYEFAATGKGKAATAFEQLGYSQQQAKDAMSNMDAFLPGFARRLLESGTSGEVVAMSMQLMGKTGNEALAFLHQLAETAKLVPTVFTEDAERAHEFQVQLAIIEQNSKVAKEQLANELLPSLNKIAKAFSEAQKEGGLLAGVIAGFRTAFTGDDMHKVNVDIVAATNRLLEAQNALDRARNLATERGFDQPHQDVFLKDYVKQVNDAKAALATFMNYKRDLEAQEEAERAAAEARAAKRGHSGLEIGGGDDAKERLHEAEETARRIVEAEKEAAREFSEAWQHYTQITIDAEKKRADDEATMWKQVFAEIDAEQERAIKEGAEYLRDTEKQAKTTNDAARQLGMTFSSAFEDAVLKGKDFRSVLAGIAQDISRIMLRKSVTEPMANAISNSLDKVDFSNGVSGLFAGAFADGGSIPAGSFGLVGEEGPELMAGPGTIIPGDQVGGGGDTYYIDARGADAGAVARLQAMFSRLDGSVEMRALNAVRRQTQKRGRDVPF